MYIEHFIGDLQVYREKWDSCIFVSKDLSSSYISDLICVYINNKIYILFYNWFFFFCFSIELLNVYTHTFCTVQ